MENCLLLNLRKKGNEVEPKNSEGFYYEYANNKNCGVWPKDITLMLAAATNFINCVRGGKKDQKEIF